MNYTAEDLMRMAQAGARNKIARYTIYGSTTTTTTTVATTATTTTTTYISPIMSGLGDNVFLYIGLGLAALLLLCMCSCMCRAYCCLNKACARCHMPSPHPI
jgi:hypothetical protein